MSPPAAPPAERRRLRPYVFWLLLALLVAAFAEAFSYAAVALVPPIQERAYRPPAVSEAAYARYLAIRDPVLGWPTTEWLAANADDRGARRSPANRAAGDAPPCVSLYGDSFTLSDEVADRHAWGDVLARRLGCRVANYGVRGYGVDQALLRLEHQIGSPGLVGEVVVLAFFPDDLNRNLSQWRFLPEGGTDPFSFKPMFGAGADGLELVPPFAGSYDAFVRLAREPGAHLPLDAYIPGDPALYRRTPAEFPYLLTLLRIVRRTMASVRSLDPGSGLNFMNYPAYYDSPDGPSALKTSTMRRIVSRYAELCRARNKRCVLMLIPDSELVHQRTRTGTHDLAGLVASPPPPLLGLDATGIFRDVADLCGALIRPEGCRGHFSPDGYRRIADFVLARLMRDAPARSLLERHALRARLTPGPGKP